jgi:alpha-beta hydrolase superfamily lysophospholipase
MKMKSRLTFFLFLFASSGALAAPSRPPLPEKVFFNSGNDRLAAIFQKPAGAGPFVTVLICHAYGEGKDPYDEMMATFAAHGLASLAFDYHGHGDSPGERYHIDVPVWVQDTKAAVDYLLTRKDVDAKHLAAFGFSSGGTAMLETAAQEPRLKVLVAMDATTRDSLTAVGDAIVHGLCWIGGLKKKLTGREIRIPLAVFAKYIPFAGDKAINQSIIKRLRARGVYWALPGGEAAFLVDTIKRVGAIRQPTLVLWGEKDQVDPVESAHVLFDALTCEKELAIIPENGHAGHLDKNRAAVFDRTVSWVIQHTAK